MMTVSFIPENPNTPRAHARISHVLAPTGKTTVPALRAYLACEATRTPVDKQTIRYTLAYGWICCERPRRKSDGAAPPERWTRFETPAQAFSTIVAATRSGKTLYVYAHNLSYHAALLALSTEAQGAGWSCTEYVPGDHLLWLTLVRGNRRICFVDTLNYWPDPLDELARRLGYVGLQPLFGPPVRAARGIDVLRAAQVTQALMHGYFDLIVAEDLGAYRRTLAAQAFVAWRHRFLHHRVLVLDDPAVSALERAAYHGGRCEVFYDLPRETPTVSLDVNSMYASVMRDELYPAWKIATGFGASLSDLTSWLGSECVIAQVALSTESPRYPDYSEHQLVFPVGQFIATLTTPELKVALAAGHIVAVGLYQRYDAQPLFVDYVDTLYGLRNDYRAAGNRVFADLCRRLLQSLYGKLGQRGWHWVRCDAPPVPGVREWRGNCTVGGESLLHRERLGQLWHRLEDGEAFESLPAIAAHVTAYGRERLWALRELAGAEHVFYCDTDSLYTDEEGAANLVAEVDPVALGKLKRVATVQRAHFRAPKDYYLDDVEVVAGIRSDAVRTGRDVYTQDEYESYDAVLNRGADGEVLVTRVRKRVRRRNRQSQATGTGWRVPLRLGG